MKTHAIVRPVLRHWYQSLKGFRSQVGLTFVLYAISRIILYAAIPPLFKVLVDALERHETLEAFYWFLLSLIAYGVIYIIWSCADYTIVRNQPTLMKVLKNDAMCSLLSLDHRFFTSTTLGGLVAKLKRYAGGIERVYDEIVFSMTRITLVLAISFTVTLIVIPWVALVIALWAVLFSVMVVYRLKKQTIYDRQVAEADSHTTAVMADIITNAPTVVAAATQKQELASFQNVTKKEEHVQKSAWIYMSHQWKLQRVFMWFLYAITVGIVLWEFHVGIVTLGTFVLVHKYVMDIQDAMFGLGQTLLRVRRSFADAIDMAEILDRKPEIQDRGECFLPPLEATICFKKVRFGYRSDTPVLHKLSLSIPSGQRVGIVGSSGSGKTTFIRLLQRLYEPSEGEILIGNVNIAHLSQHDLRSLIAYVPQDPSLFNRTIRENICYYRPDASKEEMIRAAREAQIDSFIESLPLKYETLVGERGVKLSGGQKQRIAIARALIANRPIVIFDEASSSLDNHTEYLLQQNLLEAFEGKTVLVVAHRLSTVKSLDRIIVLEEGVIVEDDSHNALLSIENGIYQSLWQRHVSAL